MPLYRGSVESLAKRGNFDSVIEHMTSQMLFRIGRRPAEPERRSWQRSLPILIQDLADAGLTNIEVLLEYQLPLTSRRVDAILAGQHPQTGRHSYVVVELKQWSGATTLDDNPELVLVDGYAHDPRLNPLAQVKGYREYLVDFVPFLMQEQCMVSGVAYLHNSAERDVQSLRCLGTEESLFTGDRRSDFMHFLTSALDTTAPGAAAADALLRAKVAPSRQLLSVAADEIQKREQFVLLDQQRLAFELVMHNVRQARSADTKSVIVVSGGPGSGKSVIALSLLGQLAREGRAALHATGSKSFTQTMRKVAGHRSPRVKALFKYFNSFMDAERNGIDVLILDEAHRIRETSVNRYTKSALRTNRPQVDELIAAARVPVFLLDENQVVRPGELGSLDEIRGYAQDLGLSVIHISLDDQFRCGGSAAYVNWVTRLLGLVPGGPLRWQADERFTVSIADSPEEMEAHLRSQLTRGYGARIAAGYCWPWSDPNADGTLVDDVVLGDWARPWNVKGDRAVGDNPPSHFWASDPAGFGQVGCIYTAQGFEYDWAGVIIGPDLVWRNGSWIADRSANRDPDFRNTTRVPDEDFDRLIRNVYKVLLTRGMVGTLIYSPDAQTRTFLRQLVR